MFRFRRGPPKHITDERTIKALEAACAAGLIVPREENNMYLRVSYQGAGGLISDKWNVKIYTSMALVCNDMQLLQDIVFQRVKEPDAGLKLIEVDDSGWGFPLLGVMVGVTDGVTVETGVLGCECFQHPAFMRKLYLKEYSDLGRSIVLGKFQANPKTHRIQICTGYVNTKLKNRLRDDGFDVRVVEVKGLLQESLEKKFREYVQKELGIDLYYDPKGGDITPKEIASQYYAAVDWGVKNAPDKLKKGWKSLAHLR